MFIFGVVLIEKSTTGKRRSKTGLTVAWLCFRVSNLRERGRFMIQVLLFEILTTKLITEVQGDFFNGHPPEFALATLRSVSR